jgi:hypothetical protein
MSLSSADEAPMAHAMAEIVKPRSEEESMAAGWLFFRVLRFGRVEEEMGLEPHCYLNASRNEHGPNSHT